MKRGKFKLLLRTFIRTHYFAELHITAGEIYNCLLQQLCSREERTRESQLDTIEYIIKTCYYLVSRFLSRELDKFKPFTNNVFHDSGDMISFL